MKRRNLFKLLGLGSLAILSALEKRAAFAKTSEKKSYVSPMDPWIEVDLSSITWNFQQIKKRVGVKIMAVVKANAYGHGLVEVSRTLEMAGADALMVGKLEEAIALRESGVKCPILNFGPFERHDAAEIIRWNISQSVYTDEALYLNESASRLKRQASIHIDIDTGMGRTGIPHDRALPLMEKLASCRNLRLEGIATTLTEDPAFDREQLRRLEEICAAARKKRINYGLRHAASSAGILTSPEFFLDMVRPGITIYGYYPNPQTQQEDPLNLRPALRLKARVIFLKDLQPDETLSYHRAFKAERPMRVATAGIGYSDGYQAQFGGKGWAIIRGKKFPVLPLVTANHLMIDLADNQEVRVGDEVTLIDSDKGSGVTADALEEASGLSSYRILIGLNPNLPRKFTPDRF